MIGIKIIQPTPGLNTTETILQIVRKRQTGVTIKEICQTINRPVSMVQKCLKILISSKSIFARKNRVGVGLIYYPSK